VCCGPCQWKQPCSLCCSVLQRAVRCGTCGGNSHVACVAVCCSVLQCVVVPAGGNSHVACRLTRCFTVTLPSSQQAPISTPMSTFLAVAAAITAVAVDFAEVVAAATRDQTFQKSAAIHCNTLQHTATHGNTLQHTATHCNTFQRKLFH